LEKSETNSNKAAVTGRTSPYAVSPFYADYMRLKRKVKRWAKGKGQNYSDFRTSHAQSKTVRRLLVAEQQHQDFLVAWSLRILNSQARRVRTSVERGDQTLFGTHILNSVGVIQSLLTQVDWVMQGFRPYDLSGFTGVGIEEKLVEPAQPLPDGFSDFIRNTNKEELVKPVPPVNPSRSDLIRAARKAFRIPHSSSKGPIPPVWGVEGQSYRSFGPRLRVEGPRRAVDKVYELVRRGVFDPGFPKVPDKGPNGFSQLERAMLHGAIGGLLVAIGRE